MLSRFRVGIIAGTHGLKGEIKIFPTTEDPGRFEDLEHLWLVGRGTEKKLTLRRVAYSGKFVILGFEEFTRIEDVERLRGCTLEVERGDALPLMEGEYYVPDLIGLTVKTEDGQILGELTEVIETGANDVYAVRRENGKELLIPVIPQCILKVDLAEGTMTVHLLPGLEDL